MATSLHTKVFPIEIYNTTDDSSGVQDLYIYSQKTPTLDNSSTNYITTEFSKAIFFFTLRNVNTLPSKCAPLVYTGEGISIKVIYHPNGVGTTPATPIDDGTNDGWVTTLPVVSSNVCAVLVSPPATTVSA